MFWKTKICIYACIFLSLLILSSCGWSKNDDTINESDAQIETQIQQEFPELESSDFWWGGDGEVQTSSRNN